MEKTTCRALSSKKKKKKKRKKKAEKDQPLTGRYLDNIEAVR